MGARALFSAIPALFLALNACKDNLATPPSGTGPDLVGPVMRLSPAHDTLVDSTGVLHVLLSVSDVSGIKKADFFILPPTSSFGTVMPLDTAVDLVYLVPLALYKHGAFRYYARGSDLLDHETVTDTVTVTVK